MKLAMNESHLYIFEGRRDRVWWYSKCRECWKLVRYDMAITVWFN